MSASPSPTDGVAARDAADDGESFSAWSGRRLDAVETALGSLLPPADQHPRRLHEAMRYAVLGGGKRIRPLLAHAAAEFGAGDAAAVESNPVRGPDPAAATDAAACAVELIHAYSLVHDDLPCMDDDDLRRGRPTVHRQFDEATAMLVGDALQALAFGALVDMGPAALPAALAELARAAGSAGMAGGQAIDLESVGQRLDRARLEDMHRRKTGAMLVASLRLGWLAGSGGRPVPEALDVYGAALGLAFQVVDDILDVEGDAATLGKTAGKDAAADKPTYVSAMGLEEARLLARALHDEAMGAIAAAGPRARRLRELAQRVVTRTS